MVRRGPIVICEEIASYAGLEEHLLSLAGYEACSVPGEGLREAVLEIDPPVVVIGISGKGRGLHLVESLRADAVAGRRGILATSTRGHLTAIDILAAGANRVLWKPFYPHRLIGEVRALAHVAPRRSVRFDLCVQPAAHGTGKGFSVDLSESGMLVWCDGNLAIGDKVMVEATVARGDFAFPAVVVRRAEECGGGHYGLRLRLRPELVRGAMQAFELEDSTPHQAGAQ